MEFYSTNSRQQRFSFKEAVQKGLPADNGLFMPESVPQLSNDFFNRLPELSLPEMGLEILRPFAGGSIPEEILSEICAEAFSFDAPLVEVKKNLFSLELYHGPTLAFKDFGARFMARALGYFNTSSIGRSTILVATSGDTGSAVANGFFKVDNVDVVILYPQGKVSDLQEQQMTTLGANIHAVAIEGSFDDCQQLVKTAFLDKQLTAQFGLTSANSINIARLLPQMLYYFYAYGRLATAGEKIVFSVPSGNYGNLTAGVIAKKMGLAIDHFIAAANANDIVPKYLQSGVFEPRPSIETISNAMDVGDPSNFVRLQELFNQSHIKFKYEVSGYSFSDGQTKETIAQVYQQSNYILDPHGAIGYRALEEYLNDHKAVGVFLETAHPVKFRQEVEPIIGSELAIPQQLQSVLKAEGLYDTCSAEFSAFKLLLNRLI